MEAPNWIEESLFYSAAFDLHEDAGGDMAKATKIATRLRDHGAREDVIAAALLHNISSQGEIFLISTDRIFGYGVSNIVTAAAPDNLSENYPSQEERLSLSDWRAKAVLLAELLTDRPDDYVERIKTISPHGRDRLLASLVGSRS